MRTGIGAERTPQRAGPQRKGSCLLETQDAFMQHSHIGNTLLQDYSKEMCIWKQLEDGIRVALSAVDRVNFQSEIQSAIALMRKASLLACHS